MVAELANSVQVVLLSLLCLWPSSKCPDLICSDARVVERIPESVKNSLEFAQEAARECREVAAKEPRIGTPSFSGFWFGFALGALAACSMLLITYLLLQFLSRALLHLQPGRAITSGNLKVAQAALPSPTATALENRPATPSDLRALGLA
jgi:hypothetical protein